jgi:AcrR family transcriptional regulator
MEEATESQSLAQLSRAKRSEIMISELEAVALRLFDERGFSEVTFQDIAAEAHVSVRTLYRYFPTKADVLQVRIDRRTEALRVALARRPLDEAPLHGLRVALLEVARMADPVLVRHWVAVVAATPSVLQAVVGGVHVKTRGVIEEFLGARFGQSSESLVPRVFSGAVGGVIEAAHTYWFQHGGDLVTTIAQSLAVLELGIGGGSDPWGSEKEWAVWHGVGGAQLRDGAR